MKRKSEMKWSVLHKDIISYGCRIGVNPGFVGEFIDIYECIQDAMYFDRFDIAEELFQAFYYWTEKMLHQMSIIADKSESQFRDCQFIYESTLVQFMRNSLLDLLPQEVA
jgi:hypothetical protein